MALSVGWHGVDGAHRTFIGGLLCAAVYFLGRQAHVIRALTSDRLHRLDRLPGTTTVVSLDGVDDGMKHNSRSALHGSTYRVNIWTRDPRGYDVGQGPQVITATALVRDSQLDLAVITAARVQRYTDKRASSSRVVPSRSPALVPL